jgi:hypothetical protein
MESCNEPAPVMDANPTIAMTPGDHGEDQRECERPGVAHPVRCAEPHDRVREEPAEARTAQRLRGVVAGELPRLGDELRSAHASPGHAAGCDTRLPRRA